jgi:DNA-binding NarL/FixJ family response regulator
MSSRKPSGGRAPRILIVDDHEIVRQGIRSLIESSRPTWQIAGEAENGAEAVEKVKILNPDVAVVDISMPVMNGLDAARTIAKLDLKCRTLIFTMHESERLISEVKQAGANGYVLKSQAARDLVAAIEKLLGGGSFFGSTSAQGTGEAGDPPPPPIQNATNPFPATLPLPF